MRTYIHSQMNLHMCAKFGYNRSSRLTASVDFWICDPLKPPKCPPGILRGELYLAYVHSQTNPHTWTNVGANRSSCLTASPDFLICDPLKPPWVIEGRIIFSLCRFPDESADLCQIRCQSVLPIDSFPKQFNVWPPKTPKCPWGIVEPILHLAYVHSQTNPPTCTNCGANRCSRLTASQDLWICDPLPPPRNASWGIEGRLGFSLCTFPDEYADVNQSWCQSVQPFDSFPRLLNVWPLKPPSARGAICLAYIHSQMHLQLCANFLANRYSRLTASQCRLLHLWHPNPPSQCLLGCWGATCI